MIEFIPLRDFPDAYYTSEDLCTWLQRCAAQYEHEIQRMTYQFCDEEMMLQYNQQFLDHDYFTDILTFPASRTSNPIQGDILINVDRLTDNARTFNVSERQELLRLLAHGLLHLCGYDDATPEEKKRMQAEEDACIKLMTD